MHILHNAQSPHVRSGMLLYVRQNVWHMKNGYTVGGHTWNVSLYSRPGRILNTCITWRCQDDVCWRQRMGRTVQLVIHNVCILWSQVHKWVLNAADGWRLWEKKKAKKSAHHRSQQSDRRTRNISKVESMYWRFFANQVFRLTFHVIVLLYCVLDSH